MCGDLEPDDRLQGDLFHRFRVHGQAALAAPESSGEWNAYLDGLFKRVLRLCLDEAEAEQAGGGGAYRHMALQSLVLARLAGFLAGHVALNEDPMRKLLEAAVLGYQEADAAPGADHHDHHDHHGHDHHVEDGHSHGPHRHHS